jgi:hypothetical protein
MSPRETLTINSSQPNSEALAVHVVLAHSRVTFHSCTCRLHKDVVVLIGYDNDDIKLLPRRPQGDDHVIDYFLCTNVRLR